ncbi:MAG: isoprenylcysteine carboxylmethyltransferase family protein [Granulosicoccus sp.]
MMKNTELQIPAQNNPGTALRTATMLYSMVCYMIGVVTLVYLILFIADLLVPVTINRGAGFAPDFKGTNAIFWNMGVVLVWGLQHSIMARPTFKRVWTKLVPLPIERSTYLVCVTMASIILVTFWIPLPAVIWDFSDMSIGWLLMGVYFLGWCIVLFSTFLINHFHLFGLQQAFEFLRRHQSKKETFQTPLLYKLVRHPMMSGVLVALWAVPTLTVGRLVFNVFMTAYVFIGLYFEERTLTAELGADYERYKETTPSVIPRLNGKQVPNHVSAGPTRQLLD